MSCNSIFSPSAFAHDDGNGNAVLTTDYPYQGDGSQTDAEGIKYFINGVLMAQMGGDGLYKGSYHPTFEASIVPGGIVSGQVKHIILRVVCKDGTTHDTAFDYTIPTPIPGVNTAPAPAPAKPKGKK